MSDPVTNIEIEDVLSSIRRLVSDEARANEKPERDVGFHSDVPPQPVELEEENASAQPEKSPEDAPAAPAALMLTPALRIEPEQAEDASEDTQSDEQVQDERQDARPALILTQSDSAEEFSQNSSDSDNDQHDENNVAQEQDDTQDTPPEAADTAQEQDVEAAQEADHSSEQHEDAVLDQHDSNAEAASENDVQFETYDDDEDAYEDAPTSAEPITIEDKIAALEALISRSDTDFEPDGSGEGGNAGRPGASLPWEDSTETRTSGMPTGALPDPSTASHTAAFHDAAAAFERAHAEAVEAAQAEMAEDASAALLGTNAVAGALDEDALRDMVAEIVRQELQGPLGERITRNVRKLVRREIYRALAANELD